MINTYLNLSRKIDQSSGRNHTITISYTMRYFVFLQNVNINDIDVFSRHSMKLKGL